LATSSTVRPFAVGNSCKRMAEFALAKGRTQICASAPLFGHADDRSGSGLGRPEA
jgi:hypothetical protein